MSHGLIRVVGTEDTIRQVQAEEHRATQERKKEAEAGITGLAAYVRKCFLAAKDAKNPFELRMLNCLERRSSKYSAAKLNAIQQAGFPPIYMGITDEKCTAAESWIIDILFPGNEKPWSIKSSPVPDLPADITEKITARVKQETLQAIEQGDYITAEQVKEALENLRAVVEKELKKESDTGCERTSRHLEDALITGRWEEAMLEFICYFCTYPIAFLKAPVVKRKKKLVWGVDEQGRRVPKPEEHFVHETTAPNPLDVYWAPDVSRLEDGYVIERHRMSRSDLHALIGVKGYNDNAIRRVLENYGQSGYKEHFLADSLRESLEGRKRDDMSPDKKIDAVQFWGNVSGQHLIDFGFSSEQIKDVTAECQVEVWLIGQYVIKAVLNPDPLGRIPYYASSFHKIAGSLVGKGLPELIADVQDVCNTAVRAACANMALAAGPQAVVDMNRLAKGEDLRVVPFKVWQSAGSGQSAGVPISFFVPPNIAPQLITIYKEFSTEADNKSGIPRYAYGIGQSTGALSTVGGMSMMMASASKGIKRVVKSIDTDAIVPSITRNYEWLLMFEPEKELVCDLYVVARGSQSLVAKEIHQLRRQELLQLLLTSDKAYALLEENNGLAEILRDVLKGLDFAEDSIIPSKDELLRTNNRARIAQVLESQMPQQQLSQGNQVDPSGRVVSGQDVKVV
ncbi:hypothetical protein [Halodesulfovibrio sp.]|jgi:hypothetical protein|uniref:portal protein n=1 Tax=Halodesulfovibrio sp. TaxID=1912772 RepID=UPI0025FFFF13|nr:hypothetical protein [Halodesulfovibrio sp.]MCT4627946.1 hypothetical protein [Halodesulfovibrio sp.]